MQVALSSLFRENIHIAVYQKICFNLRHPASYEGTLRGRHGRRVRDAVGASGRRVGYLARTNDLDATVKSCGPGIPVLMPSARRGLRLRAGDGGKTAGPRGDHV
jgi:hypothetical protein